MAAESVNERRVKVFVHLGHGFGASNWLHRHSLGLIPGLNDRLAYGYYRAAGDGWSVEYSQDASEGPLLKLCRLGVRRLLGFDLLHAWRNRAKLFAADVVWTHTELDNLAVLALFFVCGWRSHPKIIANCVWLFDRWRSLPWPRRVLYRALLRRANVVTTFSPANAEIARRVLPGVRCEYLAWGATIEELKQPRKRPTHFPLRIVSLGSDVHRDWTGLIRSFGNRKRYQVKIGTGKINPRLLAGVHNITLVSPSTAEDVKALYEWADIVVVSLKPNSHASGITVILESIILAVPVVCTDSGGLRAYFSSAEVRYVPIYAPVAMRMAVEELAGDERRRFHMVVRAQNRVMAASLTTEGFAGRHRQLSEQLLSNDLEYPSVARVRLSG